MDCPTRVGLSREASHPPCQRLIQWPRFRHAPNRRATRMRRSSRLQFQNVTSHSSNALVLDRVDSPADRLGLEVTPLELALQKTPRRNSTPTDWTPLAVTAAQAASLHGVSRAQWKLHAMCKLPRPVYLGAKAPRWRVDELREWLAAGAP